MIGGQEDFNQAKAYFKKGNHNEAVKWFKKAAEQGFAKAQYSLGAMYAKGRGVGQNDNEAVKWLRKAADQGFAEAQYNLGAMYTNGRGVVQSDNEAVKWFKKAAEQGLAAAGEALKRFHG